MNTTTTTAIARLFTEGLKRGLITLEDVENLRNTLDALELGFAEEAMDNESGWRLLQGRADLASQLLDELAK